MPSRSRIRVEEIARHPAFRRLVGPGGPDDRAGIAVDLRYAGTNNFAGRCLYRDLDCAWLRIEAAAGLAEAARWLAARRPGWRLLVLDALRPHRVQEAIWAEVAGTPDAAYFADPAAGSMHSYGMAVDVTLLDAHGREAGAAEMGSGFDEMSEASHPALHAEHLASGRLSAGQVALRELLRQAMSAGGFAGIATEWWHFDHGPRERVRREFPLVE
ncbi:MAG: D-alanyl-D-alanine dipeptidase [Burkholderiales bacterium]|nr:D-alanyl-D-alanine dipeptidase [Burkholderiales bacterium]